MIKLSCKCIVLALAAAGFAHLALVLGGLEGAHLQHVWSTRVNTTAAWVQLQLLALLCWACTAAAAMLAVWALGAALDQRQHDANGPAATKAAAANQGMLDGVVDVWVLAGQSNMVGWNAADGQPLPDAAKAWPGKILAYKKQDGGWCDAVANVHLGVWGYADAGSCGPEMAFARTLIENGTSNQVGLVPTACGGTNLFEQWRPGGLLWSNMIQETSGALATLNGRGRLRGIIWIQGESDAGTMEQAFAYGANFRAWLSATRLALANLHPAVPVLMVVMAVRDRKSAFPFIDIVAAQQRALALPGLLKVEMAGFEFYPQPPASGAAADGPLVHLTKAGECALGVGLGLLVAARQAVGLI